MQGIFRAIFGAAGRYNRRQGAPWRAPGPPRPEPTSELTVHVILRVLEVLDTIGVNAHQRAGLPLLQVSQLADQGAGVEDLRELGSLEGQVERVGKRRRHDAR